MAKKKQQDDLSDLVTFCNAVVISLGISNTGLTKLQQKMVKALNQKKDKIFLSAARGFGKSSVLSFYLLWKVYHNPEEKIIILSANTDLARDRVRFLRDCIKTVPFLQHLEPKPGQRDQSTSFDVGPSSPSPNPTFTSKGLGSAITGLRANLIVLDDIEISTNINKSDTNRAIETVLNEAVHILLPIPGVKTLILGTPHSSASFYNSLEQRGFHRLKYPCKKWDGQQWRPTDPERFPMSILNEREKAVSRQEFMLQMMLDTTLSDEDLFPLKLRNLKVLPGGPQREGTFETIYKTANPVENVHVHGSQGGDRLYKGSGIGRTIPWERTIMAIDPATDRGKDETAIIVGGFCNGYLHVLECFSIPAWSEQNMRLIEEKCEKFDVHEILVETLGVGGLAINLMQPYVKRKMTPLRGNTKKEKRIVDSLVPLLELEKIVLYEDMVVQDVNKGNASLLTQLTMMTKLQKTTLKNDDFVDCLSFLGAYSIDSLSLDSDYMNQQRRQEAFDAELDRIMNGDNTKNLIYTSRSGRGGRLSW